MMMRSCEQLEIDTKDICLLCLGSRSDLNCFDSPSTLPSLQGFKHLLRYLNVSPNKLFNCSSEFLQSMKIREDIDLKINLCLGCSSVTEKFHMLYQNYERIQLQFSDCVRSLHESMSKGNENPERVRKYMDQMRPTKSSDLVNASIAANLRNETLKKCSVKLQSVTPKVVLPKPNVEKLLKSTAEVVEEDCSGDSNSKTCVSEHVAILDMEANFFKNKLKSQARSNNQTTVPVPEPEVFLRRNTPTKLLQRSTEEIPDISVIAQVKPIIPSLVQKKSYFNAIRKKLKTKPQPTPTATNATSTKTSDQSFGHGTNNAKICEYCKVRYSSRSIRAHVFVGHPEHFIIKFLPGNISLDLCKQGIHAVWEDMFQVSTNQCQFCNVKLSERKGLKYHLMWSHAEEFAVKVLETIQSLSSELIQQVSPTGEQIAMEAQQHVVSSHHIACSSTLRTPQYQSNTHLGEDINLTNQQLVRQEIDFDVSMEEERFIKLESQQPEIVELDPLDMDYLN